MTLQITYQPPLDAPQLHYFMRFEQANAHTEYLPHVAAVPVAWRDPHRDIGRSQQPLTLYPHLQHVTFHKDQLSRISAACP
jgi:hypothetical protein